MNIVIDQKNYCIQDLIWHKMYRIDFNTNTLPIQSQLKMHTERQTLYWK